MLREEVESGEGAPERLPGKARPCGQRSCAVRRGPAVRAAPTRGRLRRASTLRPLPRAGSSPRGPRRCFLLSVLTLSFLAWVWFAGL